MTIGKIGSLFASNGDNPLNQRASATTAAPSVAAEAAEAKAKNASQADRAKSSDAVVVSHNMRELKSSETQEVSDPKRAARINELKSQVDNKTYQPNSQLVAASIFLELA
jgi:anti-sigma28 factor (negative regulator of flagellin synthesis)